MKSHFDDISDGTCRLVTKKYSTSFSTAVKMLAPAMRQDVYNIYGFVRLADEIVDSFHDYDRAHLFYKLKSDLSIALRDKISINPILNAFQHTVHRYSIPFSLIDAFMGSMEKDLSEMQGLSVEEYKNYIYGSADVVGLMCLVVFVNGDKDRYEKLKDGAMRLGSAFQKINFLRDLKMDYQVLNRSYFPNANLASLADNQKYAIIAEIEDDLRAGYQGIVELPLEAKLGVYVAYVYYRKLLSKLKGTPSKEIMHARIRVPNYQKIGLFAKCYVDYKLNLI